MSVRISGRPHGTGLTLVEVAFALSVLAVALLGVAGMFPSAMRSVHVGGQTTKATVLARGMVDMIRADAFDSLVSRYNAFDTSRWTIACPLSPSTPAGLDPDFNKKKWTCDMAETGSRRGAARSPWSARSSI
jgi:Tfp pilus assembly protein PilV